MTSQKLCVLQQRSTHVETVIHLSQRIPDDTIRIGLDLDELETTPAESKATYAQIKAYIAEHFDGMKVSTLNIAQVKQKHGIIERENYNKPKSENPSTRKCSPEKEAAIEGTMRWFKMI